MFQSIRTKVLVIFFVDLIEIDINKPVYKTVHYQQSLTLNLVRPGTGRGECIYANIKLRVLSQVLVMVNSWKGLQNIKRGP